MALVQRRTQWVGIVNVTPDSFSNDTVSASPIQQAETLIAQGASVVDIGAESTRPGAIPLTWEEDWQRLGDVLPKIKKALSGTTVALSVDTRHAEVARRALDAGADWINDVSGFFSPDMVTVVKESNCMLVMMHSLSVPVDPKKILPVNSDPIEVVATWAEKRVITLTGWGIARERIILDPGIGFGKTAKHSMEIIDRISELQMLKLKLMVGHSRKSFLTLLTSAPAAERDEVTLSVSKKLIGKVDYLRVHNVGAHVTAFGRVKSIA